MLYDMMIDNMVKNFKPLNLKEIHQPSTIWQLIVQLRSQSCNLPIAIPEINVVTHLNVYLD